MSEAMAAAVRASMRNLRHIDLTTLVKPFDFSAYFTENFKDIWWTSAPTNIRPLRGEVELQDVYELLRSEGLPLVPCPRPEIVLELVRADDARGRRAVLDHRSSEVVDDCALVFERLSSSPLAGMYAGFASDAVSAFRSGAWRSAQAMSSAVATTILDPIRKSGDETWTAAADPKKGADFPESLDNAPPYEFWVLAPLWHAYEKAYDGDLVDKWGRHSSIHKVSDVHYNVANSVISLLFLAALLDFIALGSFADE